MVRDADRFRGEMRRRNRVFPTHTAKYGHREAEPAVSNPGDTGVPGPETVSVAFLGRVALLAVAAYAFNTGFKIHGGPATLWVVLEMLLYGAALGCLLASFLVRDGWSPRIQIVVALLLGTLITVGVGYEITVLNPNYATDVMAFAHGGAEILLDGNNPYAASAEEVDEITGRFGVVPTRTADGGVIDWLISYLAMHLLSYTTLLALGFSDLRWGTLIVELVALAVIWRALSPKGRLVAPLVLLVEPFLTVVFTGGGVTDWLWVLPVAVAAISLHRRSYGYAGIALGLACAVKQHPWFAVPFVLIWVVQTLRSEHDGRLSIAARAFLVGFLGGLAAGFVVPNLPFVLWDAEAWFQGMFSPALGGMVADGHGLTLLVSRHLMDLPSEFFLVLVVAGLVGAMAVYVRYFHRLQNLLIPPAIMFLSYRSLHSYFVLWMPIALLWLDLRVRWSRQSHTVSMAET